MTTFLPRFKPRTDPVQAGGVQQFFGDWGLGLGSTYRGQGSPPISRGQMPSDPGFDSFFQQEMASNDPTRIQQAIRLRRERQQFADDNARSSAEFQQAQTGWQTMQNGRPPQAPNGGVNQFLGNRPLSPADRRGTTPVAGQRAAGGSIGQGSVRQPLGQIKPLGAGFGHGYAGRGGGSAFTSFAGR